MAPSEQAIVALRKAVESALGGPLAPDCDIAIALDALAETLCVGHKVSKVDGVCPVCKWAYASGPGTLAGNEDL